MSEPQPPKQKDLWDKIGVFLPLVQAAVLALVGIYFTTVVEAGFKSQELKLSQVREMREQFGALFDEDVTDHEAFKNALMLATFGPPAIDPLIIALTIHAGDIQGPAAREGLRFIGFTHPTDTCEASLRIIQNRTRRFPWRAYHLAICLVGETGCDDAESVLASFQHRLSVTPADVLAKQFAETPPFGEEALKELKSAVADSLRVLDGNSPTSLSCGWGAP